MQERYRRVMACQGPRSRSLPGKARGFRGQDTVEPHRDFGVVMAFDGVPIGISDELAKHEDLFFVPTELDQTALLPHYCVQDEGDGGEFDLHVTSMVLGRDGHPRFLSTFVDFFLRQEQATTSV